MGPQSRKNSVLKSALTILFLGRAAPPIKRNILLRAESSGGLSIVGAGSPKFRQTHWGLIPPTVLARADEVIE
jgi:hypothetical protein